jgi:3-hydroxyacyl-CoA dehydrogenase
MSGRSVIRRRRGSYDSHAEAAVADADFVQKTPRMLPIKRDLYTSIDTALRSDANVGSSTAGLARQHLIRLPRRPRGLLAGIRATRRPAILSSMSKH